MSYYVKRTGGRVIARGIQSLSKAKAIAGDDWDRNGEQSNVIMTGDEEGFHLFTSGGAGDRRRGRKTMAGRRRKARKGRKSSKRYHPRKSSTKAAYRKGYKAGCRAARKSRRHRKSSRRRSRR